MSMIRQQCIVASGADTATLTAIDRSKSWVSNQRTFEVELGPDFDKIWFVGRMAKAQASIKVVT